MGGVCVNTVGSYYCSCPPPLVLDDTQRNCVNSSHLTIGKSSTFILSLLTSSPSCSLRKQDEDCPPPPHSLRSQRCSSCSVSRGCCLAADENLSLCWQHVTADLVCQSPLLGPQVTFMDCCCLYGEGWGMECALCPEQDSGKYLAGHLTLTEC